MAASATPQTSNPVGPDQDISRTEVFEILSNDRRRHALHYLMSREGGTDIRDLSEQIAAWENDESVEAVSSTERRRVYVSLYQNHLPRMEEAGLLEYENSRDAIELTERGESLRVYMEVVEGNDIPWSEFYLGLTAFTAAFMAASWIGAPLFGLLGGYQAAAVVLGLFLAASVAHIYYSQRLGVEGKPPELDQ